MRQEVHLQGATLMVSNISLLPFQAKGLQVLTLDRIVLKGVGEHINAWEMVLYQHASLKEFRMDTCIPALNQEL